MNLLKKENRENFFLIISNINSGISLSISLILLSLSLFSKYSSLVFRAKSNLEFSLLEKSVLFSFGILFNFLGDLLLLVLLLFIFSHSSVESEFGVLSLLLFLLLLSMLPFLFLSILIAMFFFSVLFTFLLGLIVSAILRKEKSIFED